MTSDEEYKLFLNHVIGLTERRQSVSTTHLSVNAAITAAIAFLFKGGQLTGWPEQLAALVLLTSGIVASGLWRRLIREYSTLIGWWYEKLRTLEDGMPGSSKLVAKEYEDWYAKERGKRAIGLSDYEAGLAWVFTIIYVLSSVGILIALVWELV